MTDDELDDFLGDLLESKSKPRARLNKLTMTSRANKGTVMFVPIPAGIDGKFYRKIDRVREVNQFTDLNEKVEGDCWHKILPKECYANLTPEHEMLYDQVVAMFDKLYDSGAWGDGQERAGVARYRTYNILYGYVLAHTTEEGKPVENSVGHPACLMWPTNRMLDGLFTAIEGKKLASKGNVSWLNRYFSRATTGRVGALVVKTEGGQGGYKLAVSFESNSEDNPYLVPADLDLEDAFKMCQDPLDDYLGWQGDAENGYFREDLFLEMREYLTGYFLEDGKTINPEYLGGAEESSAAAPTDPLA